MKMDYRRDLQHNYLVAEDGEDTEKYHKNDDRKSGAGTSGV